MDENSNSNLKLLKIGTAVAAILAIIALVIGFIFPLGGNPTRPLTYDQVEPFVKDYLVKSNIVDSNGMVKAPNTGDDITEVTIKEVIDQLIATGKFDYLKGEKGDTGAQGVTGATGAQGEQGIPGSYAGKGDKGDTGAVGPQGASGPRGIQGEKGDKGDTGATGATGAAGEDGLITAVDTNIFAVSGGTLSLKPCAVDKVLMSDGTAWACATVSSSGVDDNTTNVSAALSLTGTSIEASLTDSEGKTIKTPALDLGGTFATDAELASAISALNLSNYATSADLTALTTRVTTLETTSSDHESRIDALEAGEATGYVTDTELTTALGQYYTKSQTYSQSEVDGKISTLNTNIAAKQDKLPTCANGEVVKYNTTTTKWECASDLNNVSSDGSNFATENWVSTYVTNQNFATTSSLNTLADTVSGLSTGLTNLDTRVDALENAGYVKTSDLAPYLKTADLTAEMKTRLVAGTAISINESNGTITINSVGQTDIFEVTSSHSSIGTPNPNKIYVDTGITPAEQWVYEGGAWMKIGEVNANMSGYSTTDQMNTAIANAISNNNAGYVTTASLTPLLAAKADQSALTTTNTNLGTTNTNLATAQQDITDLENNLTNNYTTTSALTPMLAAKQDKLPTCADGEIIKYVLSSSSWACGADNNTTTDLTGYAQESWVTSQITANNNNYTTTTALNTMLANYATKADMNTALNDVATNTDIDDNYVKKSALNCNASQAMLGSATNGTISCRAIQDITTGSLSTNNNLITANTLATVMATYYTKTEIDTKLEKMATGADGPIVFEIVTTMPDPASQSPGTVYLVKGAN